MPVHQLNTRTERDQQVISLTLRDEETKRKKKKKEKEGNIHVAVLATFLEYFPRVTTDSLLGGNSTMMNEKKIFYTATSVSLFPRSSWLVSFTTPLSRARLVLAIVPTNYAY